MNSIKIDSHFKSHMRRLNLAERENLERSILSEGCRDALVIWQEEGVLIDGHNRYEICTKNELPYRLEYKNFENREAALDWIIDNQFGRRNLSPDEFTYYIGKLYRLRKQARGGQVAGVRQNDAPTRTSETIAQKHNVGSRTVERAGKYTEAVDKLAEATTPETREMILGGEIKATHQEIQELADIVEEKPEEVNQIIADIKAGKAETVKDAKGIRETLKNADQRYIDFCNRWSFTDVNYVDFFLEWFDSNHTDNSKFEQIEFSGYLEIPNGKKYHVHDSLRLLRQGEKEWAKVVRKIEMDASQMDKRHAILKAPDEIYSVIYADPAWQYSNSGLNGAAEKHYSTMPTPKICTLLQDNNIKVQENAVLFMWTTNSHIPDALDVIKAWGFEYKANFVWVKDKPAYGKLAFYNRGQHELLFVAVRGKFTPFHDKELLPVSIIEAAKGEHSAKPDETRDLIESLYPEQRYLELFARNHEPRNRWVFWGNEENEVLNAAA
jgi:N6-adenosine-specific RNA methylase IME4